MNFLGLDQLLRAALQEDLGRGDITTNAILDGWPVQKAKGTAMPEFWPEKSSSWLAGLFSCVSFSYWEMWSQKFISTRVKGLLRASEHCEGKPPCYSRGNGLHLIFCSECPGSQPRPGNLWI